MRIDNPLVFGSLTTSGSVLWQASGSFTGSFVGNGANLTGIIPQGTISSSAQLADAISGSINLNENFSNRKLVLPNDKNYKKNFGRNLFSLLRQNASDAENGAGLDLINTH